MSQTTQVFKSRSNHHGEGTHYIAAEVLDVIRLGDPANIFLQWAKADSEEHAIDLLLELDDPPWRYDVFRVHESTVVGGSGAFESAEGSCAPEHIRSVEHKR